MRTKAAAIAGSAGFLVIAPGVVAGLVPWWLTGWQQGAEWPVPVRVAGGLLITAGAATLLGSFAQFALEGRGTPAPPAPTEHLVVRGVYRYVRNPMYLSVTAIVLGEVMLTRSRALLGYWAVWFLAANLFVLLYEEPTLRERFGPSYEAYTQRVGRWLPRFRSRPDAG